MFHFWKKAAFVKAHFTLLFQPDLEKTNFSSLVRVWKCEGLWFEHLVFIWAENRDWIRNRVFVVPDTAVGPSPVWHRNSPWLRECTKAHYWAPLRWLAGSPFAIRRQELPLNRNGGVGRLLHWAESSAALTLPLLGLHQAQGTAVPSRLAASLHCFLTSCLCPTKNWR